jgi:hypothetical protein
VKAKTVAYEDEKVALIAPAVMKGEIKKRK